MEELTKEELETICECVKDRHYNLSKVVQTGYTDKIRRAANEDLHPTNLLWEKVERILEEKKNEKK